MNQPDFLRSRLLPAFLGTALALIAHSAVAQTSNVSIYGLLDLGVAKQTGQPTTLSRGYLNWLGFTGSEDLGGGLSATFNLMHRFLPDSGANESGTFWHGESTVGLKSDRLGHIRLGRGLTPMWGWNWQYEPWGGSWFNASLGAYQNTSRYLTNPAACVSDCPGFARVNNAVFYDSPNFGGFDLHLAGQVERETGAQRKAHGASLNYAAGNFKGMVAYERNTADATAAFLGASYDFRAAVVMGSVGRSTQPGTADQTSAVLAATVPLAGANVLRAGVGRNFQTKDHKVSLGLQHFLSKRTHVYADAYRENAATNVNGYAIGIQHAF